MMSQIPQIFGNTLKAAREAAKREILARRLPGLTLKWWGSRDAFTPKLERVYIKRGEEDVGFIGVRRRARAAGGYYDRHRTCKGDDIRMAVLAAHSEWCTRAESTVDVGDADYCIARDLAD